MARIPAECREAVNGVRRCRAATYLSETHQDKRLDEDVVFTPGRCRPCPPDGLERPRRVRVSRGVETRRESVPVGKSRPRGLCDGECITRGRHHRRVGVIGGGDDAGQAAGDVILNQPVGLVLGRRHQEGQRLVGFVLVEPEQTIEREGPRRKRFQRDRFLEPGARLLRRSDAPQEVSEHRLRISFRDSRRVALYRRNAFVEAIAEATQRVPPDVPLQFPADGRVLEDLLPCVEGRCAAADKASVLPQERRAVRAPETSMCTSAHDCA